jgi:predicted permease
MTLRRYRTFPWLEEGWRDLRFAVRSLARTPGFTSVALLVIAAGIGVNTAVFSVVDAVLLKPLTYPDPQALVQLVTTSNQVPIPVASIPEYNLWQQQSNIFQQVAAYDWGGAGTNLAGGNHPEQVLGMHVTSGYFALFGAHVVAGRSFTAAEDNPNGGHVAVLSYGLWNERFGGNPKIVGSTIRLDDQSYSVVGIIGREFVTETPVDLWIPFQFDPSSREMARRFGVAARLKPGITVAQANAQLALVADQFRRAYGSDALPPHGGFAAVLLQESLVGSTRFPLVVLLGAVGFVLLIACANAANLMLARASVRTHEFATRVALGAGRGQIIRQLLTESLALSLAGGLLGLMIGFAGVRLLLSISPGDIPRIGENGSAVTLDPRILLFTLGISLLWLGARDFRVGTQSHYRAQRTFRTFRHGTSAWQDSLLAGGKRDSFGCGSRHRSLFTHPDFPEVAGCQPWFHYPQRAQRVYVDNREPVSNNGPCGRNRSRRPGAPHGCPGSARRVCERLPAVAGLFRDRL